MNLIRSWYDRHFSDPQVFILAMLLVVGALVILFFGRILTPILAAVIIAYLLEGLVAQLIKHRIPRLAAVLIVFLSFMAFGLFLAFALAPQISAQIAEIVGEMPSIVARGQKALLQLPERYPEFITQGQVLNLVTYLQTEVAGLGQRLLSFSIASMRGIVTFLVYLILVPLMVFFFMKDKDKILAWVSGFAPRDSSLSYQVWKEVDRQTGNYVRGKFWEILIVWSVSYIVFFLLELKFAMLMGLIVGLSVVVPYVGATVVTFPIFLVGFYQWGFGTDLISLMIAYGVIQLLDGNLLVPILLSEVVNLHPVAIITAVLVFGGLWGFWGVFFAIPLATLVQAVLRAWPRLSDQKAT